MTFFQNSLKDRMMNQLNVECKWKTLSEHTSHLHTNNNNIKFQLMVTTDYTNFSVINYNDYMFFSIVG